MNGLGLLLLLFLVTRSQQQRPPPPPPAQPRPEPRPPAGRFEEITPLPETIELDVGATYLAQVDVPGLLAALVTESAIRSGLEADGFVPVTVTQERPTFWPSQDSASWYIVASYSGTAQARPMPSSIRRLWLAVA
jgi:hypothetical protein